MKLLITGSNGLLGQKIINQCIKKNIDYIACSKGENRNSNCPSDKYVDLDITIAEKIEEIVSKTKPTHIINTAAITNVDYCEDHIELCHEVNVLAVQSLFDISKKQNIHFTHLSTDFVFDGENGPYKEDDIPNPLSIYAKSKFKSEKILLKSDYKNWAIVRTIIVYGQAENLSRSNLVLWSIGELKKGNQINIVDDQFRAPTWADDLAWACIQIAKQDEKGIFHISGEITRSIYDWTCIIADYFDYDKNLIKAIKSDTLNQKAKRPPKTGFYIDKAKNKLDYQPISFENSLKRLSLD